MLAPIDAKVTFMVEGDPITLRLNFRAVALAEKHGINLLAIEDPNLSMTEAAILVKCLAVQDHPEFTEDHTLALVAKAPEALANALIELFSSYGGEKAAEEVGNVVKRKPRAKR